VFVVSAGEGMFGKVYTAVNMDTGAYMAMKEVILHLSPPGTSTPYKRWSKCTMKK